MAAARTRTVNARLGSIILQLARLLSENAGSGIILYFSAANNATQLKHQQTVIGLTVTLTRDHPIKAIVSQGLGLVVILSLFQRLIVVLKSKNLDHKY